MKCPEIQQWLLDWKAGTPAPVPIEQHLQKCPACRQQQQLLARLDEQARQMPVPLANPAMKRQLWDRIAGSPRAPVAVSRDRIKQRVVWIRRITAAAVAASLLFAIGWLVGRSSVSPTEPIDPLRQTPLVRNGDATRTGDENAFILRVIKHDVHLATAVAADEKLAVLHQLADDLKDETLRAARQGAPDKVPPLAESYQRVVREGIVRWAALLPAEKRPGLVDTVLRRVRQAQAEVEAVAHAALPIVADVLQPMATTTQESSRRIENNQPAEEAKPFSDKIMQAFPLLAELIQRGLKLAEETDPLRRAEICSNLARRLTPTFVLLSARDDTALAEVAGACFADLLEWGVAHNLDTAARQDEKQTRHADVDKVRQQSAEVLDVLERNVAQAPADAKEGLAQALAATAPAKERLAHPGKDNSQPPWQRENAKSGGKGKGHVPPGLLKKKMSYLAPEPERNPQAPLWAALSAGPRCLNYAATLKSS